jgi:hypothetical protein
MKTLIACALAVLAFVAYAAVIAPDKLDRIPAALLFIGAAIGFAHLTGIGRHHS